VWRAATPLMLRGHVIFFRTDKDSFFSFFSFFSFANGEKNFVERIRYEVINVYSLLEFYYDYNNNKKKKVAFTTFCQILFVARPTREL
jgi:hypothetical protein